MVGRFFVQVVRAEDRWNIIGSLDQVQPMVWLRGLSCETEANLAAETLELGFDHYERSEWVDAERELCSPALKGCAEAQCMLGTIYGLGLGCAPDHAEAERWYRSAAELGHPLAAWNLGVQLQVLGRLDQGKRWKRRAIALGFDLVDPASVLPVRADG